MTWLKAYHRIFLRLSLWLICLLSASSVFAQQGVLPGEVVQTNPKDRPVEVTASVPPQGAPPAPILVRPENNDIYRTGKILFQWKGVDHVSAIDRYELYLNGQLKFGPIHITNQETDDYILTYNATENLYSLQLKQEAALADGVYTWKIRVIDTNDRGTDSTTWTFTIDSTPPPIIVTEIDKDPYAISASDPSTFPTEPISVRDRSPVIRGNSETGSELEVVVRYPDGTIWHMYTTEVLSGGGFVINFSNVPLDTVMHLTITAIDPATNTTVLDAIDLIYRSPEIVIPLPDIFPFPLTIRVRIPGQIIEIPDIDLPDIPGLPQPEPAEPTTTPSPRPEEKPVTPTEQVFTRPVQPLGMLFVGIWLGLGWYVLALYWITGNRWTWFFLI
ncbi:hypothetical protein LRY60_00610 [Candidatus Woesebacteria bacterium]|nr:hypothetical protein [Candidatus Woesebacteria bacterium]